MSVIAEKLTELRKNKELIKIDIAGEPARFGLILDFSDDLLCLARLSKRGHHEGLEVISLTGDEVFSWGSQELAGIEDMFSARKVAIEEINVPTSSMSEALVWCREQEVKVVLKLDDLTEVAGSVVEVDDFYLSFDALDYQSVSTERFLIPTATVASFVSFDCEVEDTVFTDPLLVDQAEILN